ncbi:hypothetical protein B0O80DRAFT_13677 [Mortierella sp. GBAus27b]|nr:hypothetical protein BGX31_003014 [Mortierella sp. GBA43]KAI8363451.1 hypothetical protein B0O80DRAFT_13677 [Mortierella sp. GBAus27b]
MDIAQSSFSVPGYSGENGTYHSLGGAVDPKKATNTTGLTSQLVISIALGISTFLLFCILRRRWTTMFAPRTKLRRHTPPILSSTFFGWIPQLLRIPEAEVLECVGLDAVMLLRFFHMAFKMFLYCSIPGFLVIVPVYHFFPNGDEDDKSDDDDDVWTMGKGIKGLRETPIINLITQFVFTWAFTLLTIYTIWHTYEGYIAIRRKYMQRRAKSIANRSVMITELPDHLQNDRALATFYESLGVGTVQSAHVCRHVSKLKEWVEERARALRSLEKAYTEYLGNPSVVPGYDPKQIVAGNDELPMEGSDENTNEHAPLLRTQDRKRPTMKLGLFGLFGKEEDKITHWRRNFDALDKKVQTKRLSRVFASTTVGFVTFEEMHSAQILAQTVNSQETLTCQTTLAPEPRDVFWANLNLPSSELGLRTVVVNTTVFVLVFFWSGPTILLSSLLNLESLDKVIPGLSKFAASHPILQNVIQGFLPTLGVTIFLSVVPKILEALSIRQGIQSHSGLARSIFNKYFFFSFVNVVLVFTVAGTWIHTINKVYHNLGELALLLAISLPRVSPFFVNYVILKGIGEFPLRLLQIGDVIVQTLMGFLAKTPRDYAEARAPPELHHGVVYSDGTLIFVIVLIYSCIKPMILGFGVLYFALGYLVFKYQLLYVFYHPYESGGLTWPMVYNRIMVGLVLFQSTMLGLFMLKKSYILGGLITPLMIGTIAFWNYTTNRYKRTAEFIPLELLRPADIQAEIQRHHSYPQEQSDAAPDNVAIQTGRDSNLSSGSITQRGSKRSVTTPGGTLRHLPKSVVEDDDYQAIPDRYTDYRQPPMTLFPGVLNSNQRQYGHPAIAGPLPTLWLPLKKGADVKRSPDDEESRIGNQPQSSDGQEGHDHVDAALSRRPFMLATQPSDAPRTSQEGDNLVGGGQDDDLANPATDTSTAPTTGRGPQGFPEGSSQSATESSAQGEDSKRTSAVEGVNDVYYHHPERQDTQSSGTPDRPRTVQGQGSRDALGDASGSNASTSANPPADPK